MFSFSTFHKCVTDGRTVGRTDQRTDGRTDGGTYGHTLLQRCEAMVERLDQVIGWAEGVTGDYFRSVVHLVDCGSSVWLLLLRGCCCRCSSCCFSCCCCCCCVHVAPTILIRCVQGRKRKEVWDTTVGDGRKHLKMNAILFSKQPLPVRRSSHRRLSS